MNVAMASKYVDVTLIIFPFLSFFLSTKKSAQQN